MKCKILISINLNSVGMVLQDEPQKNFISVWSCQFSNKEKITM